MANTVSKEEFVNKIIAYAIKNEKFRAKLLKEPNKAIEKFCGNKHSEFNFVVHQDTMNTINIVLPPTGELTDKELDSITGGYNIFGFLCEGECGSKHPHSF